MEERILQELKNASAVVTQTYNLKLLTPAAIHGAKPKEKAEFRVTSLRGVLRYWWRASSAALELKNLKDQESCYFGGIDRESGGKSSIRFQLQQHVNSLVQSELLPHRNGIGMKRPALQPGLCICIHMESRKPFTMEENDASKLKNAMELFLMVGSIGQRARRGFGAMQWDQHQFKNVDEYMRRLKELLRSLNREVGISSDAYNNVKLDDGTHLQLYGRPLLVAVWIGEGKERAEDATKKFGEASHLRRGRPSLGAGNKRLASPLWGTVREIGGRYYPIISELHSNEFGNESYKKDRDEFLTHMGVRGIAGN
ncbi:type III-B CRISPR module RAMP protein Cmr1 [Paenibacillus sp. IB182496]|uniref:Type III-B CRISPR module RAMP protein Cmr1 n=1 Tax=Paenibacillus sabuli TaxID=2772509 RepID=A0A927BQ35_9BACL|nr:type III-B CRISPR module RAMP protein Cmr1 [Paenibacillus sabuli]MBD2843610.1 type III-B CRISPR module RAMP protein Cmr1 [Paenibacillus sabuli]